MLLDFSFCKRVRGNVIFAIQDFFAFLNNVGFHIRNLFIKYQIISISLSITKLKHSIFSRAKIIKYYKLLVLLFLFLLAISNIFSQNNLVVPNRESANWGYSYDSTKVYLEELSHNPYVSIDSIGASVEGRAIWMVNISDLSQYFGVKYRVAIHARTHPDEVQSQWLTQRIIEILGGDSDLAKILRSRVIFNIVPMYNPDGVELGYGRLNAHGIDLERNWFVDEHEPEVAALKNKYFEFMNSSKPINIMLNMHGDKGANNGYFYFHHENGTSLEYTEIQKQFISMTQQYFPNGIGDWNRSVSWTDGNPMLFPESWFWVNYQENVLAITFEEYPIASRIDTTFDKTATALLNAIVDYLDIRNTVNVNDYSQTMSPNLEQNYPNPFNPSTIIKYQIPAQALPASRQGRNDNLQVVLKVYDILGSEVATLVNEDQKPGYYEVDFNADRLASGIYFYKLQAGEFMETKRMILMK